MKRLILECGSLRGWACDRGLRATYYRLPVDGGYRRWTLGCHWFWLAMEWRP